MDLILWRLVPWRPRLRPSRRHLRSLLAFGGATTAVGIMAAFLAEFDNLVVGRVLGITQLGYYSIATKLPYLFIISLASVSGDVLFPAFATLQLAEMGSAFLTALRYTAMVALPLTAIFATLAQPITLAVFGPQWQPAVAAAQVLCLWAVMSPISMVCGNAFKSRGRADLVLYLAIPQAIAVVVGSLLLVRQGIVVISWLQAVIAVLAQIFTIALAKRMFGLRTRSVLTAIGPPLIASSGLALVLFGVHRAIAASWPSIIVGGAIGLPVYLLLLHALAPSLLPRLRQIAFPSRAGSDPHPGEFESAIAAGEPDAMVRPAPTVNRETG
jgi:O-antigen/teichoic acid export membrane protein